MRSVSTQLSIEESTSRTRSVTHLGVLCSSVATVSSSTQTHIADKHFVSEVVAWIDFGATLRSASPSAGSDYQCESKSDCDLLNTTSAESIATACDDRRGSVPRVGLLYSAQLRFLRFCAMCGQPNLSECTQISYVGTILTVVTKCLTGCKFTWNSQDTMSATHAAGVPEGNSALACATLLSRSSYAVISRICSTMGLPVI